MLLKRMPLSLKSTLMPNRVQASSQRTVKVTTQSLRGILSTELNILPQSNTKTCSSHHPG